MARKKKAPAVKSNLRNLPDKKQRAIDRIGNIVTMIEITNDTDIKAYELEPVYQEIGGGGGSQYVIGKQTVTLSTTPVTLTDVAEDLLDYEYIAVVISAEGTTEATIAKQTPGHIVYYDFALVNGSLSFRIDTTNMTLFSTTPDAPSIPGVEIWACPVYM